MAEEERDLEEEPRQGYVEQERGISLAGPWDKYGRSCDNQELLRELIYLAGSVEDEVLVQAYKVIYLQIVQPPRVAYPCNIQPPKVASQGSLPG